MKAQEFLFNPDPSSKLTKLTSSGALFGFTSSKMIDLECFGVFFKVVSKFLKLSKVDSLFYYNKE